MKEVIEHIFEVINEYGVDLCDIDMLVRTDEKGEGFVLFIWIKDENKDDIVWFGINCKTPKYHLFDNETKNHLLVYEFND